MSRQTEKAREKIREAEEEAIRAERTIHDVNQEILQTEINKSKIHAKEAEEERLRNVRESHNRLESRISQEKDIGLLRQEDENRLRGERPIRDLNESNILPPTHHRQVEEQRLRNEQHQHMHDTNIHSTGMIRHEDENRLRNERPIHDAQHHSVHLQTNIRSSEMPRALDRDRDNSLRKIEEERLRSERVIRETEDLHMEKPKTLMDKISNTLEKIVGPSKDAHEKTADKLERKAEDLRKEAELLDHDQRKKIDKQREKLAEETSKMEQLVKQPDLRGDLNRNAANLEQSAEEIRRLAAIRKEHEKQCH